MGSWANFAVALEYWSQIRISNFGKIWMYIYIYIYIYRYTYFPPQAFFLPTINTKTMVLRTLLTKIKGAYILRRWRFFKTLTHNHELCVFCKEINNKSRYVQQDALFLFQQTAHKTCICVYFRKDKMRPITSRRFA